MSTKVKECKRCGEVPLSRMKVVDGIELHDLVCGNVDCCSIKGAFAKSRTVEHWNEMQDTINEAKVAKYYKDLEGHGVYNRTPSYVTDISDLANVDFSNDPDSDIEIDFKEKYIMGFDPYQENKVSQHNKDATTDKIPVDDVQPEVIKEMSKEEEASKLRILTGGITHAAQVEYIKVTK